MPIRYEIRGGVVYADVGTTLDAEEILAFYRSLEHDPAFIPGMAFLVDARRVTVVDQLASLQSSARAAKQTPIFRVPTRSAALVGNAFVYGVVRQWAAHIAASQLETQPFYDEVEAREWLNASNTDRLDIDTS